METIKLSKNILFEGIKEIYSFEPEVYSVVAPIILLNSGVSFRRYIRFDPVEEPILHREIYEKMNFQCNNKLSNKIDFKEVGFLFLEDFDNESMITVADIKYVIKKITNYI